jgi:hypothetical protein
MKDRSHFHFPIDIPLALALIGFQGHTSSAQSGHHPIHFHRQPRDARACLLLPLRLPEVLVRSLFPHLLHLVVLTCQKGFSNRLEHLAHLPS